MNQPHPQPRLSLRTDVGNPDHHLWCNNGTWWMHLTVHHTDGTKQRVRRSLKTHDLVTARQRRDRLIQQLGTNQSAGELAMAA
ncbi:MAG: hypothetical protein K8R87_06755 [Verrucomicrobia bacterium]|nr:hypothetical protein [Verrucomicrobiota bacterium]